MAVVKPCIDCQAEGITTKRKPALDRRGNQVPGGRCVTHSRAKRKERSLGAWGSRLMKVYGITVVQYWMIYDAQGGFCYLCRRAKGTGKKRLSVDHCHTTGFVRGLLCSHCNRDIIGHLRDEPEAFQRGYEYLTNPPAWGIIGQIVAPIHLAENLDIERED